MHSRSSRHWLQRCCGHRHRGRVVWAAAAAASTAAVPLAQRRQVPHDPPAHDARVRESGSGSSGAVLDAAAEEPASLARLCLAGARLARHNHGLVAARRVRLLEHAPVRALGDGKHVRRARVNGGVAGKTARSSNSHRRGGMRVASHKRRDIVETWECLVGIEADHYVTRECVDAPSIVAPLPGEIGESVARAGREVEPATTHNNARRGPSCMLFILAMSSVSTWCDASPGCVSANSTVRVCQGHRGNERCGNQPTIDSMSHR